MPVPGRKLCAATYSNAYSHCKSNAYGHTYGYDQTYTNPKDRSYAKGSADAPTAPMTLKGRKTRLNWRGATSPNIDIYRNNVLIATQPNEPGVYTDSTGDTGRAQDRYRVCEAGTATCSNDVLVRFQ